MELKNLNSLKSWRLKVDTKTAILGSLYRKMGQIGYYEYLQKDFENFDFAPIYGHFKFDLWPFSQFSAKDQT